MQGFYENQQNYRIENSETLLDEERYILPHMVAQCVFPFPEKDLDLGENLEEAFVALGTRLDSSDDKLEYGIG